MNYKIAFTTQASADYDFWKKNNPKMAEKIKRILHELEEHPFVGMGKPEQLKHQFAGVWSRRINKKDRLIYQVKDDVVLVIVLSMKFHYDDK